MILNSKLRFKITNISRIILSQCIKSLNLQECAIFESYEKVCNISDVFDYVCGDRMRFLSYSCGKAGQ